MLLMHKLGQNHKAIQDYDEAIRLDRQEAIAYANRAISYWELGQQDKADADKKKACELDSKLCK